MNRAIPLVLTHLLVFGAGYGWHRFSTIGDRRTTHDPVETPDPVPKVAVRSPGVVSQVMGESPWSGGQCRKAWQALKHADIPVAEKAELRQRILREWAMRDLRSALIALSDRQTLNSTEISNTLQRAFDGHEEEMLDWIKAGEFGLDGSELLSALVDRVSYNNPPLLLKMLPMLPEDFQQRALETLFGSHSYPGPDASAMKERIAGIAGLPEERLRSLAWQAALEGLANRGEDQFHECLASPDLPPDARRMALDSFAAALAGTSVPAKAMEQFRKLSPEDQVAIGPAVLDEAKKISFARPNAVTNAINMLAESGQWELLARQGPGAVDEFFKSSKPNPEAVCRWAIQLPGREETAAIFRHAVAPRLRENLNSGMEWAISLPEGWHRQQALAQLAITADSHFNAPMTRQKILGLITDPAIQAELKQWRKTKE